MRPIQCYECPNIYTTSFGFGVDAEILERLEDDLRRRFDTTNTGYAMSVVKESLVTILDENSQANWDGESAVAISNAAIIEVLKLINLIPESSIPMPEILPEPNGEIGLQWFKNKRHVFVVSLSGKQKMTYAGIFGDYKTHGTDYFGETLPTILIENLRRLYHQ